MKFALRARCVKRSLLPVKCSRKRLQSRVDPPPEYKRPEVQIPKGFFHFCEVCATGVGLVECPECDGAGIVKTRPGGAGVSGVRGWARCKICEGMGIIPCPLCAGCPLPLRPPRDPSIDFPGYEKEKKDD